MSVDFDSFFAHVTGNKPYPYQSRMGREEWPEILNVPTGLGKTAAVVVSWLWKAMQRPAQAPRRLVYCLPMRVLVEQTEACCQRWVERAAEYFQKAQQIFPTVHLLIGGDVDESWIRYPERPAILIGTQDMLISRALMRGYSQSRFQWPWSFGLLHTDAQWVFDEVQIMGSALATSAQLEAFRREMGLMHPSRTLWMSATMSSDWLQTIDFRPFVSSLRKHSLEEADRRESTAQQRLGASKPISLISVAGKGAGKDVAKKLAEAVKERHTPGSLTLVILNTVDRAIELQKLLDAKKKSYDLVLLHSRYRPRERQEKNAQIQSPIPDGGRIIVSTQVVEAGVDLDAKVLFTEIAPWASMVQRFGRCNRSGSQQSPAVYWVDLDDRKAPPYTPEELAESRDLLGRHSDVGPNSLLNHQFQAPQTMVLRRRDFIDLFDTTPDLTGFDIDISPFIRETEDHDVRVFWRNIEGSAPPAEEAHPERAELCPVPIGSFKDWLKNHPAWKWEQLESAWVRVRSTQVYPGLVLMLDAKEGGYEPAVGWSPSSRAKVPVLGNDRGTPEESVDNDSRSVGSWTTIQEHSEKVTNVLRAICASVGIPPEFMEKVELAGHLHDVGKAHPVFQASMLGNPPENDVTKIWAKTVRKGVRHSRPGFRHELVSATLLLMKKYPDLTCYLAASHHGRVRLQIRSLPNELSQGAGDAHDRPPRFALGVWEGDRMPEVVLNDRLKIDPTTLDLSFMELGEGPLGESWAARMLALRDHPEIGPFRLAFLEALLRSADARGSEVGK